MNSKPKRRITQPRKIKNPERTRNFDAAKHSRHTADWVTGEGTADKHLRQDIATLRERGRDLERNDGYAEAFLSEMESNVVGDKGFGFKPLARKADGRANGGVLGKIDVGACEKIAAAYDDFSKRGNFDVTRQHSRPQFARLCIRSMIRDGGTLVRYVDGFPNNEYRFAVQGLEMEVLDPRYSDAEKNIHMSIQFDEWGAPVGYYLQIPDPRSFGLGFKSREKERVDADNIRHLFYSRRFSQSHGYSGFAPIMTPLRHLSKYEEAEVIAARASANKIGFFETTESEGYTGDEDGSGNIKAPSGPGEWEQLPMGVKPHLIDPSHPNANYPDFRKAMLRKACAGLVANYNVIGRDLEGVSFSSIRQGVLSERDAYRILHAFMIQEHELPTFERWLRMALLAGKIDGLDIRDYDRLKHVEFSGRTWPWVDPVKDIQAAREEIDLGINSRQSISREKGRDFAKMVAQNEEDAAMLEAAGLNSAASNKAPAPAPAPPAPNLPDDDE